MSRAEQVIPRRYSSTDPAPLIPIESQRIPILAPAPIGSTVRGDYCPLPIDLGQLVYCIGGPDAGALPFITSRALLKHAPGWLCRRPPGEDMFHHYVRTEDPFVYEYEGSCPHGDDHDWPDC